MDRAEHSSTKMESIFPDFSRMNSSKQLKYRLLYEPGRGGDLAFASLRSTPAHGTDHRQSTAHARHQTVTEHANVRWGQNMHTLGHNPCTVRAGPKRGPRPGQGHSGPAASVRCAACACAVCACAMRGPAALSEESSTARSEARSRTRPGVSSLTPSSQTCHQKCASQSVFVRRCRGGCGGVSGGAMGG